MIQFDNESRPIFQPVPKNAAPVRIDGLLRDGETEANALLAARHERFKELLGDSRRGAGTGI